MRRAPRAAMAAFITGVLLGAAACGDQQGSPAPATEGPPATPTPLSAEATPTPPPALEPTPAASQDPSPPATPEPTPAPSPTPPPIERPTVEATARANDDSISVRGQIAVHDQPVSGAPLRISALPIAGRPQTVELTGTVPDGAASAHVGIRVNIEDIAEHGKANITIYRASYTESGRKRNHVPNPGLRHDANGWGLHEDGIRVVRSDLGPGLAIRVADRASQATVINTGGFPVKPGKAFRATMRLRVSEATVGHAYFTVTWLSDVTEIGRERLYLEPAPIQLPAREAATDGRFQATFRDLEPGRYRIRVEYAGDATHDPVTWEQVARVR